ncbi:hypothetical protein [Acinetobacter sp.]|uniref:hypothetical protein n=1 Tax=Acinetobacter sp. TaxID=472 RepID=UPI00388E0127
MTPSYRFYSFVAGLYLSPLQRGLQTAHAVSEMHADLIASDMFPLDNTPSIERKAFDNWAQNDKVIVILDALNSAGVIAAYDKACFFAETLKLPTSIFYEDEQSLNEAATAAAIVVPDYFYEAYHVIDTPSYNGFWKSLFSKPENPKIMFRYERRNDVGEVIETIDYERSSREYDFISFLKSFKLAQS